MANITELEIEGVRLPLGEITISVNMQANNIGELKDRQSNFTNKFAILNTPLAQKLFSGLGLIGNVSRAPYRILKSVLIYNGVPVLVNGNAYITGKNTKGEFLVSIYDGNIFLFQEIGNKALNELNLSDLNHALNPTTFIDSFDNVSGYIYGISNNGQFTPTASPEGIQINYQIPSVFVSTIWDRIFSETSFGYSGTVFDSQKFKDLVLTMKRGYNSEFDIIVNPVNLHFIGFSYDIEYDVEVIEMQGDDDFFIWDAKFDLSEFDNEGILNNGVLTILEDSNYSINWDLVLTNIPPISDVNVVFKKLNAGGEILFQELTEGFDGTFSTAETFEFQAVAGEQYVFEITIHGEQEYIDPSNVITNVSGDFELEDSVSTLIDINIASFIGDLPITSFIKDIMQHFGLVIQLAQGSTTYQFEQMDFILSNKENAYDWSNMFVQTLGESYQLKNYAQKNRFAYSYFDDNASPFADGFLLVNNQNLKPEATVLTRPFNACVPSKTTLNGNPITLTPYWEVERDEDGVIIKYNPIDNKNYLAEIRRINESIVYDVSGGTGNSLTGMIPRLDFRNLNYSQILEENYSVLQEFLDWNDVRKCSVRLKAQDVRDFDFFRLVFIEQLSSYFYVNKISFTGKEVGTAEIVRVKTSVVGPPQPIIGQIPLINVSGPATKSTLDAGGTYGKADLFFWELISFPVGGTFVIDDDTAQRTFGTFNSTVGDYEIKLTVNRGQKEKTKIIKITTFI